MLTGLGKQDATSLFEALLKHSCCRGKVTNLVYMDTEYLKNSHVSSGFGHAKMALSRRPIDKN